MKISIEPITNKICIYSRCRQHADFRVIKDPESQGAPWTNHYCKKHFVQKIENNESW